MSRNLTSIGQIGIGSSTQTPLNTKVGRNDSCICGSGRKFKHCCGVHADQKQTNAEETPKIARLIREGNILLSQNLLSDAISCFNEAIKLDSGRPESWACLGYALDSAGQYGKAIEAYRQALEIRPNFFRVHNNLGLSFQATNQYEAAEESFRQAISIEPGYIEAHFNLGRLLQIRGLPSDAAKCYQQALSFDPRNAQAASNLGIAQEEMGFIENAISSYRLAIQLDPTLVAARSRLANALERVVPAWHVPMMNDKKRNEAYYRALRGIVTPNSSVFEIGTGSGLLSMMAARLGAREVVTCEAEPLIAKTAQKIISSNGLDTQIKQLSKRSTEVALGQDLTCQADILVSEIFSSELLGERVLPAIEDAKRRLLRPGGRVIPAVGSIMVALFGGEDVGLNLRVDDVAGFDLSGFNQIVSQRRTIARTDLSIDMLSADVEAFRFDFERDNHWPAQKKILRIPVRQSGRCLGLIQWMHLSMGEGTTFENHPAISTPASSWTRCAYLLPLPIDINPSQTVIVEAVHNRVCPWFVIHGIE